MTLLLAIILSGCLAGSGGCSKQTSAPPSAPASAISTPAATSDTPVVRPPRQDLHLPPDLTKFALIISGISGEESYAKQFAQWSADLRQALIERLAFAPEHVKLLSENPGEGAARATAEEVRNVFAEWQQMIKPEHTIFIFFIGHGSFDGKEAKFNLVGPDLSANDYALLFKKLAARRLIIINMASASGEFIKSLSAPGRIVITATRSGMEQNATRFPEYLIAALTHPEADADKNERISILEAFNYATKLTAEWYEREGRLATEHALIDDNGDGKGHQKAEEGDGTLAKTTYFDSLPQQRAGGDAQLEQLFAERTRLEGEIEQLKARKEEMKPEEYEAALEKLLIELAKLNQSIKARQK